MSLSEDQTRLKLEHFSVGISLYLLHNFIRLIALIFLRSEVASRIPAGKLLNLANQIIQELIKNILSWLTEKRMLYKKIK